MPKKSIALLGGEGFVGRNIGDFLLKEYDCFSVSRTPSPFPGRKTSFIPVDPYHQGLGITPAVLVHLIDNQLSGIEFEKAERQLIENTFTDDLRHVVVFSSAAVYVTPASEYGKRKILLEKIFQEACQQKGIPLTIFRLFNTFGKYQLPYRRGSLVANIIFNHLTQQTIEISNVFNTRDYIFAGDIGMFVDYAITRNITGTFDLASNRIIQLGELIKALEDGVFLGGIEFIDNKNPRDISPKGNNPFLWSLQLTPLTKALKNTVEFYRHNLENVKSIIG